MIDLYPGLLSSLLLIAGFGLLLTVLPLRSGLARALVVAFALFFNARYLGWRLTATLTAPELSGTFSWVALIYVAELIAVGSVSLHLLLMLRSTDLRPLARAGEARLRRSDELPSVDVFIATFDEPQHVLTRTLDAAARLDYPRKTIWVLDDGDRDWVAEESRARGLRYLNRRERVGFKAGNLNNALASSDGDFVLCLDADFAVAPNFLFRTLGLFDDPRIGIVQTPQRFVNPDPIQVNLGGTHAWPEEQRVFTDVMQSARDAWSNAFCYGTNFVARRRALDRIGGFPQDSLCEDLYTTYLMKAEGFETRYLNEPLARGLAAESLPEFIKQRCRWCAGTVQCLFLPGGPLRARNLSPVDRILFLDPILFYLGLSWVFLMMLSPAVFWWTGAPPFNSELGHLLTMLAPRMGLSMLALYWLSDRKVVPVVSELGRVVGIFYYARVLAATILRPRRQSFQVTLKGTGREHRTVRWRIMAPHLVLALATSGGLVFNLLRPQSLLVEWNPNLGLGVALTAYVLWLSFLSVLACVEPADPEGGLAAPFTGVAQGGLVRSAWALLRRISAPPVARAPWP